MLGSTHLGVLDVLAEGEVVERLAVIIGTDNRRDIGHIYAAYINECEYFVTEDVQAFINDGRKEALEDLLGLKIHRTAEVLAAQQS